ncbi:MAG: hypothetical protein PHV16_03935 [Candidatus Nanoarchaeia archaeon]|nr:hypothetical protein [Candidatus Nanoarchaeia archaeon]
MEFSEKRLEQIKNMPIVESRVSKSKDGKFIMHKTVITDIKPVKYYDAVMENQGEEIAE